MNNLNRIIYYTTILSIFTEAARINIGFDLKLFYFVVLINFFILAYFGKIKYSKGLLIFHSIIVFSGFTSCVFGYNNSGYFLAQLFFLLLIPVYYYSFFWMFKNRFQENISLYCKLSFWVAFIGIVKFPFDFIQSYGLHSIMLEPAHYCTIILPALFITLKNSAFPRYYYKIILLSIILSGSSLGYISLGLLSIFYVNKFSYMKTSFSIVISILFVLAIYQTYPPFQLRLDDTTVSFSSGDLSKANLSTYALLSNFFVSSKSFASNPLLGNGIGSHSISRSKYLGNIEGIEIFEEIGMEHLNAKDAGSLFSRLMSELGLLGIVGVIYFIWKFYVPTTKNKLTNNTIISRAILLYFFCKLLREGHYFSPEMYFFIYIYINNKIFSLENRFNKLELLNN